MKENVQKIREPIKWDNHPTCSKIKMTNLDENHEYLISYRRKDCKQMKKIINLKDQQHAKLIGQN